MIENSMPRFCAGDDFTTKRFGISDSDLANMSFKLDTAKKLPDGCPCAPSLLYAMSYLHYLNKNAKNNPNKRKSQTEKNYNNKKYKNKNNKFIESLSLMSTPSSPSKATVIKYDDFGKPLVIKMNITPFF